MVYLVYRPFFVLSFLVISHQSNASFNFSKELQTAYKHLFELKTVTARQEIEQALKKDKNNGIAIYLENYTDVVECIISGDKARYLLLKIKIDERLSQIDQIKSNSPYKDFVTSELKLQIAFTKLYFQDRVSAFWSLRQAYKIAKKNSENYPDFLPSKKTVGLLELLIGSVPDEHKWIINSVGLNGTHQHGLTLLNEVLEGNTVQKKETEILIYLTQFYLLQNSPIEQLKEVNKLYQSDRENLLTAFIYASMLHKQGRNEETIAVLTRLPDGHEYVNFYYLTAMLGDCYLYKGQYKLALTNYSYFINHYQGQHYLKSIHFKTSLAYWLLDDYDHAEKHRLLTIEKGVEYFDSDKKAMKYAKQNIDINKILLQAQLYHDGGYYNEALSLLNKNDVSTFHSHVEQLEYFYRKGRIYQKIGFVDKAVRHYVSAINTTKDGDNFYFAPNACLQLGYIFRDLGKRDKAIFYFEKAMKYSGHEYKNSIDSQAKTALNDLSVK